MPKKMNQHSERSTYHVQEWHAIEDAASASASAPALASSDSVDDDDGAADGQMKMATCGHGSINTKTSSQWAMHRKRLLKQTKVPARSPSGED